MSTDSEEKLDEAIKLTKEFEKKLKERIEKERKRKEREEKEERLRNLRSTVDRLWKELVKLTNGQNELTNEYKQLDSLQTYSEEQLDAAIGKYERFKEKLEICIATKRNEKLQILKSDIEKLWSILITLIGEPNDLSENYSELLLIPTDTNEQLDAAIVAYGRFKEKVENRINTARKRKAREEKEERLRNLITQVDQLYSNLMTDNIDSYINELDESTNQSTFQDLVNEHTLLTKMPTHTDEQLDTAIKAFEKFKQKLEKYIEKNEEAERKRKEEEERKRKEAEEEERRRKEEQERKRKKISELLDDIKYIFEHNLDLDDESPEYKKLKNETNENLDERINSLEQFKQELLDKVDEMFEKAICIGNNNDNDDDVKKEEKIIPRSLDKHDDSKKENIKPPTTKNKKDDNINDYKKSSKKSEEPNKNTITIDDKKSDSKNEEENVEQYIVSAMNQCFSGTFSIINKVTISGRTYRRISTADLPAIFDRFSISFALDPKALPRARKKAMDFIKKMIGDKKFITVKESHNLILQMIKNSYKYWHYGVSDKNLLEIIEKFFDDETSIKINEIDDKKVREWIRSEMKQYQILFQFENNKYVIKDKLSDRIINSNIDWIKEMMVTFLKTKSELLNYFSMEELGYIFDDEVLNSFVDKEEGGIKYTKDKICEILNDSYVVLLEDNNNNEQYIIKDNSIKKSNLTNKDVSITKKEIISGNNIEEFIENDIPTFVVDYIVEHGIWDVIQEKCETFANDEKLLLVFIDNIIRSWYFNKTLFLSKQVKKFKTMLKNYMNDILIKARIKIEDNGERTIIWDRRNMKLEDFYDVIIIDKIMTMPVNKYGEYVEVYIDAIKDFYGDFDEKKFNDEIKDLYLDWTEKVERILDSIDESVSSVCKKSQATILPKNNLISKKIFEYLYKVDWDDDKKYSESEFIDFLVAIIKETYEVEIRDIFVNDNIKKIVKDYFEKNKIIETKKDFLPKIYTKASELINEIAIKHKVDFKEGYDRKYLKADDFIDEKMSEIVYIFNDCRFTDRSEVSKSIFKQIRETLTGLHKALYGYIRASEINEIIATNLPENLECKYDLIVENYKKILLEIEEAISNYLPTFTVGYDDKKYLFYDEKNVAINESDMIMEIATFFDRKYHDDMNLIFDNPTNNEILEIFKMIITSYISNWITYTTSKKSYDEYVLSVKRKDKKMIAQKVAQKFIELLDEQIVTGIEEKKFDEIWQRIIDKFNDNEWKEKNKKTISYICLKLFCQYKKINGDFIENLDNDIKNDIKKEVENLIEERKNQSRSIALVLLSLWLNDKQYTIYEEDFFKKFDDDEWKNKGANKSSIEHLARLLNCDVEKINSDKINNLDVITKIITRSSIKNAYVVMQEKSTESLQQNTNENTPAKDTIISQLICFLTELWSTDHYENWKDFATKFNDNKWRKKDRVRTIIACLAVLLKCRIDAINSEKIMSLDEKIKNDVCNNEIEPIKQNSDNIEQNEEEEAEQNK